MTYCDPKHSKFKRLLVICPEALRLSVGATEDVMEDFDGKRWLRLYPEYSSTQENAYSWVSESTNYPKVQLQQYGFSAKINDERGFLLYLVMLIAGISGSTTFPDYSKWRPVTVVDFVRPDLHSWREGVTQGVEPYAIRHGNISIDAGSIGQPMGRWGAEQVFLKGGFSFTFQQMGFGDIFGFGN